MPLIELTTEIDAPIERCFDLARSIDFHMKTTEKTGEEAIAGCISGLIGMDESVTWRANHLFVWQQLTSKVIGYERPYFFNDRMQKGAFAELCHEHHFEFSNGKTILRDKFYYRSPFGILGHFVDWLFLEKYMRRFLVERNVLLKEYAEGDGWRQYLPEIPEH